LVGDAEVVLELSHDEVRGLAVEVTLLVLGLISKLRLRSRRNQRVDLTRASEARDMRAIVRVLAADHVTFELPENQLEYLQMVFMRAYRDDMAEVNHVHLEGVCEDRQVDLTFLFETFKPPLSPDEAKRLMGDE
jgi:hypothetical protein